MPLTADSLSVIVVDDDPHIRSMLTDGLTPLGHRVTAVGSGTTALELVRREAFDVMLLDLRMPAPDGIAVLEALRRDDLDLDVVILTAYADVDNAVAAMKLGARDVLQKPIHLAELDRVVRHTAESRTARSVLPAPRPAQAAEPGELIGADPKIAALLETIERVAPTDASVLVTGESGTGKDLVARLIHRRSARAARPLVVVDCTAIAVSLFESELFGNVRSGKVAEASGGTLFLDEISDLPLDVQPRLLRFLQDPKLDTRVISATNVDVGLMVGQGILRRDLFHRLNVVQVDVPPLRERKGDIPALARRFVEQCGREVDSPAKGVAPQALALLSAYAWPGNVRELQNVITQACILAPGAVLTPESLPPRLRGGPARVDPTGPVTLADVDRRYILDVLEQQHWNITRAARVLGIHRATLYRKIMTLDLRPPTSSEEPPSG